MGFERSEGLCALSRKHSGCPVMAGDFETYDFSGMDMDGLVLVGALVHVPHDRFRGTVSNIARALKPGGYMLITLKEGQNFNRDARGRVFYLWWDEELRTVFGGLNFTVVEFFRQISKVRETDVWLGYVLTCVMLRK